jgi:hypothetical protein
MQNLITMQIGLPKPRSSAWTAIMAAPILVSSLGCQAFAPSAIGTLAASREEKRVLKAAEADPFPSPADVGITSSGAKP